MFERPRVVFLSVQYLVSWQLAGLFLSQRQKGPCLVYIFIIVINSFNTFHICILRNPVKARFLMLIKVADVIDNVVKESCCISVLEWSKLY